MSKFVPWTDEQAGAFADQNAKDPKTGLIDPVKFYAAMDAIKWAAAQIDKCETVQFSKWQTSEEFKDEIWKALPMDGFSDRYEVSNLGRVRSLKARCLRRTPRILKLQKSRSGYFTAPLSRGIEPDANPYVHRLVLLAFAGNPPTPLHECAHLDGNPENNNASNLIWATRKENHSHKTIHGTALTRDRNHQTKLDSRMASAALKLHLEYGWSFAEAARLFGVTYGVVSKIVAEHNNSREVEK